MKTDATDIAKTIIDLERALNERWSAGDCNGYLDTYSENISYFDPVVEQILVGRPAVVEHILKLYKNPHIVRSEYLNSQVVVSDAGDLAVLSYNLRTFVSDEGDNETLLRAWNSTAVYQIVDGEWRIVHSNWALTQAMGADASAS